MTDVRKELLDQQFETRVVYNPDMQTPSFPIVGGLPVEVPSKFGGIWHKAKITVPLSDGAIVTEAETRDKKTYNPTTPYQLVRHLAGANTLGVPVGKAKWYLVR